MIALVLCWIFLPEESVTRPVVPATLEDDAAERRTKSGLARIDFLGATLLGLAILTLMFPLEIGGAKIPWTHPLIFVLFGSGSVLLALFLATEAWWAKEPIFPLLLLRKRDVVASYFVAGTQVAAQLGVST